MNQAQFNEHQIEQAWKEVEHAFKSSGMVGPTSGFVDRWNERLLLEEQRADRRQAWTLVVMNVVIALGFLGLISIQVVPSLTEGSSLLDIWVDMVSKLIVTLKMFTGVFGTLQRTLPRVIPTSWVMPGLTGLGILVVLWVSMMRQHIQNQGAAYEKA